MIKNKLLVTILALSVLPLSAGTAKAESLIITGNGDGSSNDVSVNQSHEANVTQDNNAEVTNDINATANTGDNTASDNTGTDTTITTGDVSAQTSVANNLNASIANVDNCCDGSDYTAEISGNGSDSNNTLNHSVTTTTNIDVNQQAIITNNITGTAITGNNTANDNNGNVSIQTGDITVTEKLKNNTNLSITSIQSGGMGSYFLKIAGNGAGSVNTITLQETNESIVKISNVADIFNRNIWNLITGNNAANNNNGNIDIKTGDIKVTIDVENDVNFSKVTIDCGDCKQIPPPPPPPCEGDGCNPPPPCRDNCNPTPPPPPVDKSKPADGKGDGPSGPPGPGSVLGSTTGEILPSTGNPWILLAIIGNLLMLLFGSVLRLRSGRSPGILFAI